jgi:hypothetical protein
MMTKKTGGRSPRQKGNREERRLVQVLQHAGIACERVPLSGSVGGRYAGDLSIPLLGIDRCCEVKIRARGFAQIYEWLTGRDLLIVRANHCEPLCIVPLRLAIEIATAAEKSREPPR